MQNWQAHFHGKHTNSICFRPLFKHNCTGKWMALIPTLNMQSQLLFKHLPFVFSRYFNKFFRYERIHSQCFQHLLSFEYTVWFAVAYCAQNNWRNVLRWWWEIGLRFLCSESFHPDKTLYLPMSILYKKHMFGDTMNVAKKNFYLILSIAHVVAIYDCTVYTVRVDAHNCCLPLSYLGAYYCFHFKESIDWIVRI